LREAAKAEKEEKARVRASGMKGAAEAEDRAHLKQVEYDARRLHPHLHTAPAQTGAAKMRATEENG
jgi:hypothetical protein